MTLCNCVIQQNLVIIFKISNRNQATQTRVKTDYFNLCNKEILLSQF